MTVKICYWLLNPFIPEWQLSLVSSRCRLVSCMRCLPWCRSLSRCCLVPWLRVEWMHACVRCPPRRCHDFALSGCMHACVALLGGAMTSRWVDALCCRFLVVWFRNFRWDRWNCVQRHLVVFSCKTPSQLFRPNLQKLILSSTQTMFEYFDTCTALGCKCTPYSAVL